LEAIEDSFADKYDVPVKKITKIADGIKKTLDAADWEKDDHYYAYIVGTLIEKDIKFYVNCKRRCFRCC
jgi:hypothetical protein